MTDGTNETPTATGESVATEEKVESDETFTCDKCGFSVTTPDYYAHEGECPSEGCGGAMKKMVEKPIEKPAEKPTEAIKHAGGFFVLSNDIVRRFKKNRELVQGEKIKLVDGNKKALDVTIGQVERLSDCTVYHYEL